MKIHKAIQIFIQFCLIFFAVEVFAGYGELCPSASFGTNDYLKRSTAYGHIMFSIDMTNPLAPDACDPSDARFKFCLKNKEGSPKECTVITLNLNDSKTLGELSDDNPDLGGNSLLKDIILTVKIVDKRLLCLVMSTSKGPLPLACKNTTTPAPPLPPDEQCRNIGKTCYMGTTRSQSLFNFSGLAVDCMKETLDKVFFRYSNCNPKNDKVSLIALNPFSTFQESLKVSIRAALILYIMFFAVNMILSKEYGNLDKIATFVMKLIMVTYFATGIGPAYFKGGKETTDNGMLQYGLPLLTELTPQFAQIVFNSGGSRGLCEFDAKEYKNGYSFYALWDAVDCRIAYYLGMGLIYNTEAILNEAILNKVPNTVSGDTKGTALNKEDFKKPGSEAPDDLGKVGAFRFFTVLFGFLLAGNIIIVVSGLIFSVIFISIILYFLTHYLVCLVTIYVMTYISPIFIPMALFTRTKAYFDAWLKICISCALQPAVIAGFIALLLTMYDSAIYKNCQFMRHDYVHNEVQFSTFELRLPIDKPEDCRNSAGYKLLQYYSGVGWEKHLLSFFPIKSIVTDIFSLMIDLLYVLVFSIIFYYFSKSISQFAAELTGGPIMDSVTASPTKIVDMVKKGIDFIADASEKSSGKVPEKNPEEKPRKGGEEAKDSSSGGMGGGGSDMGAGGGGGGMSPGGAG
ncbi:MAG TPA: type IV secretion system protein [Rickettsia endosymbiont of Sericostoma sp.]|uniref:type IV secretion system protein n=1 Tax=Candidatus Tisiphia endosymbiont of Nemotelus uliginosus TaxID=3077926 RepID=UPI001D898531|nr:type IV secretion system protein [Rickettsia endosymbiont of Sericostoma sp.]